MGWVLGYAASNPNDFAKASSPQILEDTLILDNNEIIVSTNKLCSSDNGCGAVNPSAVDTAMRMLQSFP